MRGGAVRAGCAGLALALALVSCSDDDQDAGGEGETPRSEAAEPARSPQPAVEPVGEVSQLGPQAEGMVADPESGLVVVGLREPFRLALVEGETGRLVSEVPLPGHVRHLQLAAPGGPVLVPAEDSNTFLAVTLPSGQVEERVEVGEYPHDAAAAADGRTFVADEKGGTLSVVDDGEVVDTVEDLTQPGGVVAVEDQVAVVDVGAFTLSLYDAAEAERVDRVRAGEGPTHLVADKRGRVVVIDTRGDALLIFEGGEKIEPVEEVALPGTPYGVAYDSSRDRLWVTLTATNEVVGLDLAQGSPREVMRFPTVVQPNTVAVDAASGKVIVASRREGTLQVIEPGEDQAPA